MKINWKTALKNVSFVILALKMCVVFGQQKIIVIDPGHGGKDSGAIGVNGILEKEVVLNVAKEILRLNKFLFNNELDIYLTRYKDSLISLSDRSRLAKRLNADLFVSLHCNAYPYVARGLEVYVHKSDNTNTKNSIVLGELVSKECTRNLGFESRDIKFANFQVLRETKNFCTSILVETGFITQVDEANYLKKQKNRRAIAMAVLQGTHHYLKTL